MLLQVSGQEIHVSLGCCHIIIEVICINDYYIMAKRTEQTLFTFKPFLPPMVGFLPRHVTKVKDFEVHQS
jgi:hypothetical protein